VIGNVTVTVERPTPGGLDDYGDPVPDEDDEPTTHEVEGCSVAPRLSTETTDRAREGAVIGLTLYCPTGADIARDDTLVIGEGPHVGRYRIEGEPSDWQSGLTTWPAGVVVELQAAIG
jgi:hypothetical protein